jgi:ABC-2 type transport system permease protein
MKFLSRKWGIRMSSLMSVIKFTFMNRFRSRPFQITTIVFVLILSLGIHLPSIISAFSSDEPVKIGIFENQSPAAAMLGAYYKAQEKPDYVFVNLKDQGSQSANEQFARKQVEQDEIKGYLLFGEDDSAGIPNATYHSKGSMEFETKTKLQLALQAVKTEMLLKEANLDQDLRTKLNMPVSIDAVQIGADANAGGGKTESQVVMSYVLVYALMVMFFIIINMYGSLIATEVTSEKSSRVMEILITSVSPLYQMFGKVIGMFLLGILQIAVFVITAVINLNMPNTRKFLADMDLHFSEVPLSLYVYFALFYVLGFFLYAMLYAMIGSLLSRSEDIGQSVMPITMLGLAGFYIGIFGINAPTSAFVTITSHIPFFTPLIMFLRIGMAQPAWWEIWLSIAVLTVFILGSGWLSAKIYRVGVLMYGKRPSVKEVRKAMKALQA